MAFQFLKNTLSILQSEIAFGIAQPFAFVLPAFHLIRAPVFVPAGEITITVIFRVAIFIAQNAGRICVMNDVVAEEEFVLDDVMDDSAEKRDVAAGAERHPNIGQRAGARESRIDMDDGRAALFRFHHPAKTDWVRLGHGRAFDQDAIRVRQILLRGRSSAPAEGGAQTGHRAAMSYPGLVGHTDHAQASREKFFYEIILFVIQRRAAEVANRGSVIDRRAVLLVNKGAFPRFPNAICHHVHRLIERNFRPTFRARRAIFHFGFAP